MSSLSIMQSIQKKEKEKQEYEERKKRVLEIKNSAYDVSSDCVNSINKKMAKVSDELSKSVLGIEEIASLTNLIVERKEKIEIADSILKEYVENLDNEIKDCDTKLQELESDIAELNCQYNNAVAAENEAKKEMEKTDS